MNINILYTADLKKMLGTHSGHINIFANFYDVETRGAFLLMQLSNQNYEYLTNSKVTPSTFQVQCRVSNPLSFCNKYFDYLCTSGVFNVWSNNSIFISITWLSANTCLVNGSWLRRINIVGIYITFPTCILFITMRVIMLHACTSS